MIRVKNTADLFGGSIFFGIGISGIALGWEYEIGSTHSMGPGYLPFFACIGIILIGAITILRSLMLTGEAVIELHWRPLLLISFAVSAFALLIQPLGLFAAIIAIVAISSLAAPGGRLRDMLLATGFLSLFCWLLFVILLDQNLPLWPSLSR